MSKWHEMMKWWLSKLERVYCTYSSRNHIVIGSWRDENVSTVINNEMLNQWKKITAHHRPHRHRRRKVIMASSSASSKLENEMFIISINQPRHRKATSSKAEMKNHTSKKSKINTRHVEGGRRKGVEKEDRRRKMILKASIEDEESVNNVEKSASLRHQ